MVDWAVKERERTLIPHEALPVSRILHDKELGTRTDTVLHLAELSLRIGKEVAVVFQQIVRHLDILIERVGGRMLQACGEREVTAERMVLDHLPDEGRATHVDRVLHLT